MKTRKIINLVICVMLLLCLTACYKEWIPSEGVWYCEDLQMQVSFPDKTCIYTYNGEKVTCVFLNDYGSKWFCVISQATDVKELPVGSELFSAELTELSECGFIVREEKSGIEYIFTRIAAATE